MALRRLVQSTKRVASRAKSTSVKAPPPSARGAVVPRRDAFDDIDLPFRGLMNPLAPFAGGAMERLFNSMLPPGFPRMPRFTDLERQMERQMRQLDLPQSISVDITEQGDKYVVMAELPGVAPTDLKVEVLEDEGLLTIAAEKSTAPEAEAAAAPRDATAEAASAGSSKAATPATEGAGKDVAAAANAPAPTTWHRSERVYGRVERTLRLPSDVDVNAVTAKLEHGVLRIALPKKAPGASGPGVKRITVDA